MRNLKRALSLALASVMLVGMMVVGTSAASFPDVSAEDNTEAIAVLEAVEVMVGNENGEFEPDKNVTRNEMAVILAKLILGSDADKYVGTCPFTDVPTWAQKYVAACYDNKIVAGRTESIYDGSAVVTAQEAAAMTLRVLGYEKLESTGTNWAQPVVAKANELRLFADVGSSATAPLNRNQVAQLSLNALQTTMVTSDVEKDIVVEGVVTIPGKVTYTERTTNKFDYTQNNGAYKKDVSDEKLQLCENLYEKDLRLVAGTDDFGRPATIWSFKTEEIGKYADSADASYIKAVKSEDLYKDLGLKKSTKATVMVDGKAASGFSIDKTNDTKIGGNGVVVDAYKDDDGNVTISVINPYAGKVTKVTEAKGDDARTVTVDGTKFETEGFDVDDVVVYTKADGKIKSMYLAEIVENVEVTKTVGSPSISEFVADGETYKFAGITVDGSENVKKENKVDLYLDSNDYVVKVALNEGVTDYAYVIDIDQDGGKLFAKGTPYAKLLLTDGTVVEAELNYDDYKQLTDSNNNGLEDELAGAYKERIVEYSVNSKDVYKMAIMKNAHNSDAEAKKTALSGSQTITIDAGKAKMTLGAQTIYADSKTIFLTDDGDSNYKAYVGYDAVPDLVGTSAAGDANAAYAYYCKSGTVADVVYVLNTTSSSNDIVFLLAKECGGRITTKGGDDYYECPAVVNGEIVTVKLDEDISKKANTLLKTVIYANEDEEIIDFGSSKLYGTSGDNYYFMGKVSKKLTNGNLTISNSSYRVSNDVQVFLYSDKIESSSESAIAVDDFGYFVVNDGQIVTIFYKEADDSTTTTPPTTDSGDATKNPTGGADIDEYAGTMSVDYVKGASGGAAKVAEDALKAAGYEIKSRDTSAKTVTVVKDGIESTISYASGITEYFTVKVDNATYYVNTNGKAKGAEAVLELALNTDTYKAGTGYVVDDTTYTAYASGGTKVAVTTFGSNSKLSDNVVVKTGYVKAPTQITAGAADGGVTVVQNDANAKDFVEAGGTITYAVKYHTSGSATTDAVTLKLTVDSAADDATPGDNATIAAGANVASDSAKTVNMTVKAGQKDITTVTVTPDDSKV